MSVIHYISVDREYDYFTKFCKILEKEKERIEKVSYDKNRNKYTPNKITIGKRKTAETYINIGSGFDCETTNCKLNYTFAFPYIIQLSLGKHVFLIRNCEKVSDIFIDLSQAMQQIFPDCKLIVWDANLSFEYAFFREYWNNYITAGFAKDARHPLYIEINNNIIIRECLGVFGKSLADLAKTHTKTQKLKGDLDYDLIRSNVTEMTKRELNYCINDVVILSELTETAFNLYLRKGEKIPLTATGIVRAKVKKKLTSREKDYKAHEIWQYNKDHDLYINWRTFLYSGGLTHSLLQNSKGEPIKGQKQFDVVCFDLKSAYPWAYCTQYFPDGDMRDISDLSEYNILKALKKYRHFVIDVIVKNVTTKTNHSLISKDKCRAVEGLTNRIEIDNGRIYYADCLYLTFNEIDFNSFCSNYDFDDNMIIQKAYIFTKSKRCDKFILESILEFYQRKEKIGKEKKRVEKDLEKISSKINKTDDDKKLQNELLQKRAELTQAYNVSKSDVNGIYGMTATQIYECSMKYDNTSRGFVKGDKKEWNEKNAKTVFNPLLAYWCTSYVRSRLYEVITAYPDAVFQYDTDSVYVSIKTTGVKEFIESINNRVIAENNIAIPDNFKECRNLGLWDNDGDYEYLIPLGCKRYVGAHYDNETKSEYKKINTDANRKKIYDTYAKKYTLSENDITEFLKRKAKYKITFAGANKDDLIIASVKQNKPFEKFIISFNIASDTSTKRTASYYDAPHDAYMTDYTGHEFYASWKSGVEITDKPFNAHLVNELMKQTTLKNAIAV